MLAAIETYNKTAFEYREEAFCILMINAWEVLLKARIVDRNGNRLEKIYLREKGLRFKRSRHTGSPLTISLERALSECDVPASVQTNIETLYGVRNEISHLGPLHSDLRQKISEFGTASVENFTRLLQQWFNEPVEATHLLPVGFIGGMVGVSANPSLRQRQLLHELRRISDNSEVSGEGYDVALRVNVEIARVSGGGGTIGVTSDANAPIVRISDEELLEMFPDTFDSMRNACRNRYQNFKQNAIFNQHLRAMKANPRIVSKRSLDPQSATSQSKFFYNIDAVFQYLDEFYVRQDN